MTCVFEAFLSLIPFAFISIILMLIIKKLVDHGELLILKKTFKDLAHRSHGNTIDKDTFLAYFPLPGLIGGPRFFFIVR